LKEQVKNRLKILFATVDSWNIFLSYIKEEEEKILNINRNVIDEADLRRNQGKLQLLHSMKSLRDSLRDAELH
jgi:hypothetical protein